jgi:hypothetical protein
VTPDLLENPLHLGLGATAIPRPPFTGMDWINAPLYGKLEHAGNASLLGAISGG